MRLGASIFIACNNTIKFSFFYPFNFRCNEEKFIDYSNINRYKEEVVILSYYVKMILEWYLREKIIFTEVKI
jgi:hypothetical protein